MTRQKNLSFCNVGEVTRYNDLLQCLSVIKPHLMVNHKFVTDKLSA